MKFILIIVNFFYFASVQAADTEDTPRHNTSVSELIRMIHMFQNVPKTDYPRVLDQLQHTIQHAWLDAARRGNTLPFDLIIDNQIPQHYSCTQALIGLGNSLICFMSSHQQFEPHAVFLKFSWAMFSVCMFDENKLTLGTPACVRGRRLPLPNQWTIDDVFKKAAECNNANVIRYFLKRPPLLLFRNRDSIFQPGTQTLVCDTAFHYPFFPLYRPSFLGIMGPSEQGLEAAFTIAEENSYHEIMNLLLTDRRQYFFNFNNYKYVFMGFLLCEFFKHYANPLKGEFVYYGMDLSTIVLHGISLWTLYKIRDCILGTIYGLYVNPPKISRPFIEAFTMRNQQGNPDFEGNYERNERQQAAQRRDYSINPFRPFHNTPRDILLARNIPAVPLNEFLRNILLNIDRYENSNGIIWHVDNMNALGFFLQGIPVNYSPEIIYPKAVHAKTEDTPLTVTYEMVRRDQQYCVLRLRSVTE